MKEGGPTKIVAQIHRPNDGIPITQPTSAIIAVIPSGDANEITYTGAYFGPGITQQPFTVGAVNDADDERTQTITLQIQNAALGQANAVTITVLDNEPTKVRIEVPDARGAELPPNAVDHAQMMLVRTGEVSTALSVNLNVPSLPNGVTMGPQEDIELITSSKPIPAYQNDVPIPVIVQQDALQEDPEILTIQVLGGTGYVVSSPTSGTVTIEDDDKPNLVGHWNMEGVSGTTVPDASGKGRTGTLFGGVLAPGRIASGLGLASSRRQRVEVASHDDFKLTVGYPIGVAAWVHPSALRSGEIETVLRKIDGFSVILNGNGSVRFSYEGSGGATQTYQTAAGVLAADQWVHVAATCVIGNPGSAQIYVNGTLSGGSWVAGTGNVPPNSSNQPLVLGCSDADAFDRRFDGVLDDVRVYRTYLSSALIAGLAGAASSPTSYDRQPLGRWRMNEGSGTTTADGSGAGNNGTLVGSPLWTAGYQLNALQFAQTSLQYVQIANPASFVLGSGQEITLAGWIHPTAIGGGRTETMVVKGDDNVSKTWAFGLRDDGAGGSTGRLRYWFQGSGGGDQTFETTTSMIGNSTWRHVAVTFAAGSGNSIAFYVDGMPREAQWTEGTGDPVPASNSSPATFGAASSWNANKRFDGKLDEWRIYRKRLGPAEIKVLALEAPSSGG